MADEVKSSKVDTKKSKDIKNKKSVGKFFNEIKSELKKVIWPTRQQLINNTITVFMCCLLIGSVIWCSDALFTFLSDKFLLKK